MNRALQVAEKEVQEHAAPNVAGQQAALPMTQMGKLSLPPIVWNRLKFVLSEVHFRFQFYFLNLAALLLIFDRKNLSLFCPFFADVVWLICEQRLRSANNRFNRFPSFILFLHLIFHRTNSPIYSFS